MLELTLTGKQVSLDSLGLPQLAALLVGSISGGPHWNDDLLQPDASLQKLAASIRPTLAAGIPAVVAQ